MLTLLILFEIHILIFLNDRPLHITGSIIVSDRDHCTSKLNHITQGLTDHFNVSSLVYVILPENNLFCPSTPVFKDLFSKWQIVIKDPRTDVPDNDTFTVVPDVYIIFINDYHNVQQLQDLLDYLELYNHSWNPGAKFLLIANSNISYSKSRNYNLVFGTFSLLWKSNAHRAALVLTENGDEAITLFSSSPFSKTYHTCKEISSSTQLQEIPLTNGDLSGLIIDGFLFKSPRNFLGCPLIAYTFPFPPYSIPEKVKNSTDINLVYKSGVEINLVLLLAEAYKCSVNICTTDYIHANEWSRNLPNGSTVELYDDLLHHRIDLTFAGIIPMSHLQLSYTYAHVFSSLTWYVPNPSFILTWKLIANAFAYSTWLLLILIFISFLLLYRLMSRILPDHDKAQENMCLTMIAACLGVVVHSAPKSYHLRIMLFTWLLFCLHLTIMYNTKLFSFLTERPMGQGIKTLDDLLNSGLQTCVSKSYINIYMEKTEGTIRRLLQNAIICNNTEDAVETFIKDRNFSLLAKDIHMSFIVDEKRSHIHKLDQTFITYPAAMAFSKGNALVVPMRRMVLIVTESGLIKKWMSDLRNKAKIKFVLQEATTFTSKQVLEKKDFVWLYKLFLLGQVMAFIVFVTEVCSNKLKHHYRT